MDEQIEHVDANEPPVARQKELRLAYEKNISRGNPPYAGVALFTCGELLWLLKEHHWLHERSKKAERQLYNGVAQKADLQGISLAGVQLSGVQLCYANLKKASFNHAIYLMVWA